MVFSSIVFLFYYLPAVILLYFVLPTKLRNVFLLMVSLLFYAWGEGAYVLLMMFSIVLNFVSGKLLGETTNEAKRSAILAASVTANLLLLGYYKYAGLLVDTFVSIVSPGVESTFEAPHLPIGITFFTFQALSYVVDVYRGQVAVQKKLINLGLYISLFPQLIAGPIVRYSTIAEEIDNRKVTPNLFISGFFRFAVGLAKKVLIANTLASPVDQIYSLPADQIDPALAWLAMAFYTLQIYYDFSGYSDMAIGMGKMFGFRFLENFDHPYTSQTITEFWRRWHISLSTWFRDYLYIPLGGNRVTRWRLYANLVIVFFLCGLWHGASWTFVLWGLYHGLFLLAERAFKDRSKWAAPRQVRHFYVIWVVAFGLVLFRAESMDRFKIMVDHIFFLGPKTSPEFDVTFFLNTETLLCFLAAVVGSTPVVRNGVHKAASSLFTSAEESPGAEVLMTLGGLVLVWASAVYLSSGAHNPFIYFRF